MRRALGIIVTLLLLAAIGVGGWWAIDRYANDEPEEAAVEEEVELVAVAVVRTDLVDRETLDGTLRYAEPGVITAQKPGTVTGLPTVGDLLSRGDVAYELDGEPVIVMSGALPVWRTMAEGVSDGRDIWQLSANLVILGYDADDFEVSTEYTSVTADLVAEWQDDLGIEDTGIVELGRVVFLPRSLRIADTLVDVGATVAPGTPVLATSATRQEVQVWLDADRQDLIATGDSVELELPDETRTTGTVVEVSTVVTTLGTGPEARRVFEVTIVLDDPSAAADLDEAPVDVDVVSEQAENVLAVPVNSLLALAEGGYAVEVQAADGTTTFVAVDIGKFADGLVAVEGEIFEGDLVLVPR